MRKILLLSVSVSLLGLGACATDKTSSPAQLAQKAPAPAAAASSTEEKEMSAVMGADGNSAATLAAPANETGSAPTEEPMTVDEGAKADKITGAPGECPGVEVLPDTKSITYFDDPDGKPTGEMIARASLTDIRGGCDYTADGVIVDIDMIMQGRITDKGRYEGRRDLEAFMTFPYFVAVMDPSGKMIDKKIMATAMRFKPEIDDLDHAEKITQNIPLPDISQGSKYTITVGFQLNRQQLDYNRGTVSEVSKPVIDNKAGTAKQPVAPTPAESKKPAEVAKDAKKASGEKSETPLSEEKPATPAPTPVPAKSGGAKMSPIVE